MTQTKIEEMFAALGEVTIRRMFGGKGVYHQGRILAIEFHDEMLLKADAASAPDFAEAGCRQWSYPGKTPEKPVLMPYWSIPVEAFDDPDVMALWVSKAYHAALRAK